MKRLIICLIVAIILSSCDNRPHDKFDSPNPINGKYNSTYHIQYDNHDYIQFGSSANRSIVHNPDCPNDAAYFIRASTTSLFVYVKEVDGDKLLGEVPWSTTSIRGIDELILKDIQLNE